MFGDEWWCNTKNDEKLILRERESNVKNNGNIWIWAVALAEVIITKEEKINFKILLKWNGNWWIEWGRLI